MRAYKRLAVARRVIINTDTHAFAGILYKQSGPLLVLRDAELLEAGKPPVPIQGEVLVERNRVEFIQLTGA